MSQKPSPTIDHLIERTEPADRAEALMRLVNALLADTELPDEARRNLGAHELVNRVRAALEKNI